jgi:hypothetical protein
MILLSRRMCYIGKQLLVAVHLIDAEPTPLMGRVVECEYYAEGQYRMILEFNPIPQLDSIREWFERIGGKSTSRPRPAP